MSYTLGLDFGTDSVRALLVDVITGEEVGTGVSYYPRWRAGKYCTPAQSQFRQHPQDYIDSLEEAVREALAQAPPGAAEAVVGIAVDTTGSTPVAVNPVGTPLALLPEFAENPNAMFVLWKDHYCHPRSHRDQPTLPEGDGQLHQVRRRSVQLRVVLGQDPARTA